MRKMLEYLKMKKLYLIGLSGSGKSVIGQKIAQEKGLLWKDTDKQILNMFEKDNITEIFDEFGEETFRKVEKEIFESILASDEKCIVSTGGGLPIIDGVMDSMLKDGSVIYLTASIECLWRRLSYVPKELDDRPLLKKDGQKALEKMLNERDETYKRANYIICTECLPINESIKKVVKIIEGNNCFV